jgi:hypothetical protein
MQKIIFFQPLVLLAAALRARVAPRRQAKPPPLSGAEVPDGLRQDLGLPPKYRITRSHAPPDMNPLRFM